MNFAGARGETKIVDLSNTKSKGEMAKSRDDTRKAIVNEPSVATSLPSGLTLCEIRCAQRHKDSHLYAYLVTTRQGSSGPTLVFCNSIAAVRRVAETLKTLGLPVRMLHAQMAQVSHCSRKLMILGDDEEDEDREVSGLTAMLRSTIIDQMSY